jgi:hypothetical protein
MLISLLVILAVGCILYWGVNRAPITSPTIKNTVLIIIVVITALLMLGTATGRHLVPGL